MTDDRIRRDPLYIEEALAGRRDPGTVDPAALHAAREDEERFQREILPRTLDVVQDRSVRAGWASPLRLALVSGAAAAVAVVLVGILWDPVGVPVSRTDRAVIHDEYIGVRGGPTLDLRVRRGDQVQRWSPGEPLRSGDALRLIPYGQEYRWLLVLAVDAQRRIQVVAPFDGEVSVPLEEDGAPLPGSLILDDATGREALVAVFSRAPLAATTAEAFVTRTLEQVTEPESRSLEAGATVLVFIPYEKEAR